MNNNDSTTVLNDTSTLTALVPLWDSGEETLVLPSSGKFTCGSAPESAARILLPGVAERHCRLICRSSEVKVEPFGSHSVLVNGAAVIGAKNLTADDVLSVGPAKFRIERRQESLMCRVNVVVDRAKSVRHPTAAVEVAPGIDASSSGGASRSANGEMHAELAVDPPVERSGFTVSSSVNHQLNNLERHLTEELELPAVPSAEGIPTPSHAPLMPVLSKATQENRRRLLDAREAQLTEWYSNLELRRAELDNRSTTLARLQAQLTERQAEVESRAAELELKHAEESRMLRAENEREITDARRKIEIERAELAERDQHLNQQRVDLDAQAERVEASKQAVAEQMTELGEARRILAEERLQYQQEQKAATTELQSRESALLHQQHELDARAESFRELEMVREEVERRTAFLDAQQTELNSRAEGLVGLEANREEVVAREAALADLQTEVEERARQFEQLESVRAELDVREAELQQHLAEIQPQLEAVAQLEVTSQEIAARRQEVDEQHRAVEAEAVELSTAASEVAAEWQRIEEARQQSADISQQLEDLEEKSAHVEAKFAELNQREANADSREAELQKLAAEVTEESNSVQLAQAELSNAQIAADNVAESNHELELRENNVSTLANEIEEQRAQLAEQELALQERETATVDRETAVAAREDSAETGQTRVKELTLAVEEREAAIQSREEELSQLGEQLQAQAHEIQKAAEASISTETSENTAEVASLNEELSAARGQTEALAAERDELQGKISELNARFETERSQLQAEVTLAAADASATANVDHTEMLLEITALKAELEAMASSSGDTSELDTQVAEQKETISQLTEKLQDALSEVSVLRETSPANGDQPNAELENFHSMIEQLTQKVEEQNVEILSLRAEGGLAADDATGDVNAEEIRILHRELDDRTGLLDSREEELREQSRMLDQTKSELEEQRRTMLEARQQLELARAEIHVATNQHQEDLSATQMRAKMEADAVVEAAPEESPSPDVENETPAVRSEIAELFGLSVSDDDTPAATNSELSFDEEPRPNSTAELMSAVDDYSQENAAAVSMSFEGASDVLLEPVVEDDHTSADASDSGGSIETEEEHDDFVSSYMEQLLNRNRDSAGGSLPEELTKPGAASSKPKVDEEPTAPGQVSFIDQYMSGKFGDGNGDSGSGAEAATGTEATEPPKPRPPRTKVDVAAMRSNMNSFRELSTKSVENALATHAKRQRRGGIANGSTLFLVLSGICVMTVLASVLNVIPFGIFTWISIVAAAWSGIGLLLKMRNTQQSSQRPDHTFADRPVPPPVDTQHRAPAVAVHEPPAAEDSPVVAPPAKTEKEEQYFEL